jgi:protein-glutamine gamma-glutamyltransferase
VRFARSLAIVGLTVLGGLLFTPVFGLTALLVPVVVAASAVLAAALLCGRGGVRAADWRPLLTALAGILAVGETVLWRTTTLGLPTAATWHGLADGVTRAWWRTLETTWPARPDAGLLIFVPLLVVAAAVAGLELLHRLDGPLPAVLPGLALLIFAQAHVALAVRPAVLVALGWAALAGLALASARAGVLIPVLASAGAAVLVGTAMPAAPPRFSLRTEPELPPMLLPLTSPLDELAGRLTHQRTPVFRMRAAVAPDRWPLVVLDRFDGVDWTPGDGFLRLGARLPPGVPGPVRERTATVIGAPGPWLPSQTWPAAVEGAAPYVAPGRGTLLLPGPVDYTLHWWEPQTGGDALLDSGVDERAPGGLDPIGGVPVGMAELAVAGTGRQPPSFRAALTLEAWFRGRYRLTVGADLPVGHGWSQITEFLRTTRRGTSEQFAVAYVVLARLAGIPARIAVGYRTPARADPDGAYTIHNGDALAWPEVAVPDGGWVPLDPTGQALAGGRRPTGLAAAAEQARAAVSGDPAAAPPAAPSPSPAARPPRPWRLLLAVPATLLLWPVVVPAVRVVRAWRRRRRGVTGADREVRDRLSAYGIAVTPAMTLRDLSAVVPEAANPLNRLGAVVDRAHWSGADASEEDRREAWAAVRAVRHDMAVRGRLARLRAAVTARGLYPGPER